MSDRVHIPFSADIEKLCIDKPEGAAWGWFSGEYPKALGVDKIAWTYCPEHKGSSGLLVKHTITAEGEVNASIQCPAKGCMWHIFGILDDYAANGGLPQPKPLRT